MSLEYETVYLPGLNATELTDVVNLAKNVFNVQQAVAEPTSGTITIRAPQPIMDAITEFLDDLQDDRPVVMLDVKIFEVSTQFTKDLGTSVFPAIETPLIDGELAFRQHSGGHTPAPNWPTFLDFAGRYLQGAGARD